MDSTGVSGTIPSSSDPWTWLNLKVGYFSATQLTGTVPYWMLANDGLEELYIDSANLQGPLPSFADATTLRCVCVCVCVCLL